MKKHIYDFCGKDTDSTTFTLPVWNHIYGGLGNPIFVPKISVASIETNLCQKCLGKIADFIYDNM